MLQAALAAPSLHRLALLLIDENIPGFTTWFDHAMSPRILKALGFAVVSLDSQAAQWCKHLSSLHYWDLTLPLFQSPTTSSQRIKFQFLCASAVVCSTRNQSFDNVKITASCKVCTSRLFNSISFAVHNSGSGHSRQPRISSHSFQIRTLQLRLCLQHSTKHTGRSTTTAGHCRPNHNSTPGTRSEFQAISLSICIQHQRTTRHKKSSSVLLETLNKCMFATPMLLKKMVSKSSGGEQVLSLDNRFYCNLLMN